MAVTAGCKELKTSYPCVDGIIAGTTTQTGHIMNLEHEDSVVSAKDKVLLIG